MTARKIRLTRGMEAIVDDADFKELNKHKWYALSCNGLFYAARGIWKSGKCKTELMHRRVLGLHPGEAEVDHKNHNTLDNRRCNLRPVTRSENLCNRRSAGFWKVGDRFRAEIKVDGKTLHLGYWDDPRMARAAYLCAKQIFHPIGGVEHSE